MDAPFTTVIVSLPEELGVLENVRAMNNKFSEEYRIEQERIKAEIERKNKTRALEGKIRKLKNDIKNKEDNLRKLKEEYEKEIGSK